MKKNLLIGTFVFSLVLMPFFSFAQNQGSQITTPDPRNKPIIDEHTEILKVSSGVSEKVGNSDFKKSNQGYSDDAIENLNSRVNQLFWIVIAMLVIGLGFLISYTLKFQKRGN